MNTEELCYKGAQEIAEHRGESAAARRKGTPLWVEVIDAWNVLYGMVLAFAPDHDRVSFDVDYCWGGSSSNEQFKTLRAALRWAFTNQAYSDAYDKYMIEFDPDEKSEAGMISMITFRFYKGDKIVKTSDGYGLHTRQTEMEWESPSDHDLVVVS